MLGFSVGHVMHAPTPTPHEPHEDGPLCVLGTHPRSDYGGLCAHVAMLEATDARLRLGPEGRGPRNSGSGQPRPAKRHPAPQWPAHWGPRTSDLASEAQAVPTAGR